MSGGEDGISIYDLAKKISKQVNNYTGKIKVLGEKIMEWRQKDMFPILQKL